MVSYRKGVVQIFFFNRIHCCSCSARCASSRTCAPKAVVVILLAMSVDWVSHAELLNTCTCREVSRTRNIVGNNGMAKGNDASCNHPSSIIVVNFVPLWGISDGGGMLLVRIIWRFVVVHWWDTGFILLFVGHSNTSICFIYILMHHRFAIQLVD